MNVNMPNKNGTVRWQIKTLIICKNTVSRGGEVNVYQGDQIDKIEKIDLNGEWDKERKSDTRVKALIEKAKSGRNSVKREENCEIKRKIFQNL